MTPRMFKAYVAHGYVQCFIHASSSEELVSWMAYQVGGIVQEYYDGKLVRTYKPTMWG